MLKIINMKSAYGNYSVFEKEFKDQRHLDNWIGYMERKGHKIIGINNKD